jgi:hypothetical protein
MRKNLLAGITAGALALAFSSAALAGPTLGFTEEFPAIGGTAGFAGGALLSNPGTGGRDGDGDGYLRIAQEPIAGPVACYNAGPDYGGDYLAAGVTRVVFWLSDVDTDENLEIHLVIGNAGNFWLYNQGFAPPEGSWAAFEVDLTDSTNFTQIRSFPGGPYTLALSAADRLHWRHDTTPYSQLADPIVGQFGLDGIFLTNNANAVVDLPAPPVETIRLAAFPNPAAGMTSIAAELARPSDVRLRVVSATGRIVREIYAGHVPAGPVTFPWDGRDASGTRVSAGAYFLKLTTGEQSVVGRIVIAP